MADNMLYYGDKLTPGYIHDFARVIEREKTVMGYFICIEQPTPGMYQTAEDAGMVVAPNSRLIPCLQLRTVHELMHNGKTFDFPQGYILRSSKHLLKRDHEHTTLGF